MKKLLVVLLAFACVFAVSAQVTTGVTLDGKINVLNATAKNATNPQTGIATDADDVLSFTVADKDGKFGGMIKYSDIGKSVVSGVTVAVSGTTVTPTLTTASVPNLDSWKVWYQYDWGKVQIGTAGDGFNGDMNNDIIDKWDTDGQGAGLYYITPAFSGFTAELYLNGPTTAIDAYDAFRSSGVSFQYVMENVLKIQALATAGLVNDSSKANIYVGFTGVENLEVYGDFQWDQTNADTFADFGAGYTIGALKVIAEGEANFGGANFLYDAGLRVNYKVSDALSFRVQGAFLADKDYDATTTAADPSYYGKAYVFYTVGNGLTANLMLGYDSVNEFIYQLYAGYKISI